MPWISLQDMPFTESASFPFSPSVFILFPFLSLLSVSFSHSYLHLLLPFEKAAYSNGLP